MGLLRRFAAVAPLRPPALAVVSLLEPPTASNVLARLRPPISVGLALPAAPDTLTVAPGLDETTSIDVPLALTAPATFAVSAELGVTTAGKRYGRPLPGDAEIRREQQRQEIDRDRIRRAAHHGPVPNVIAEDIFEKIRPILMPPLSEGGAEVIDLPTDLRDYQRYGVSWLLEAPGRLLADDMGLGKTAQAITAFRALVRRGEGLNALVVAPASLLENWRREFARWAPELRTFVIEGNDVERAIAWRSARNAYHVLITTYDRVRNDSREVRGVTANRPFDVLILDEVQYVKNAAAGRTQAIRNVGAKRRWGLSGTPLENSVEEFATILTTLLGRRVPEQQARSEAVTHMLRRRKSEALGDLPCLIANTKYLALEPAQRRAYRRALEEGVAKLGAMGNEVTLTNVLSLISALKQICNGVDGQSCKTAFVLEYLEDLPPDEKVLLFSQFKEHFGRLGAAFAPWQPLTYTGDLSVAARDQVVHRFKTVPAHRLLLMTLGAGGVGLNLQEANHVIHYDSWWNPARSAQATGRVHRLGQERVVVETTLICSDTIEEQIDALLATKRELFDRVVDDLADVQLAGVLSEQELFALFGLQPPRARRLPAR